MIEIKHPFTSAVPDGPNPNKVNATQWNEGHTLTQAGQRMLGKPDAGAGPTAEMDGSAVRAFAGAETSGAAAAAVAAHEGAADPHVGYQKESEKGAVNGYASLDGAGTVPDAQIPGGIARDSEVTAAIAAHEAAGDPHPGYQLESEKSAANGYASLGADGKVPAAQLPAGAAPAFTTVEVSLAAAPNARRSGKVQVTGLAGLTPGKPVMIQQAVGPYTGKGARADESEMDQLQLNATVLSVDTIDVYWKSQHRVRGNFKLNYLVGA